MEWVGVSWRRRSATPLIWQRMGDNESVSYSTTAAIVYAVSSVFFFFLVLFLFVVGLTPMTPCFSCTKCLKKRWVTTPEEKIDWGVKELEDSCPKCFKKKPSLQKEKKDWAIIELDERWEGSIGQEDFPDSDRGNNGYLWLSKRLSWCRSSGLFWNQEAMKGWRDAQMKSNNFVLAVPLTRLLVGQIWFWKQLIWSWKQAKHISKRTGIASMPHFRGDVVKENFFSRLGTLSPFMLPFSFSIWGIWPLFFKSRWKISTRSVPLNILLLWIRLCYRHVWLFTICTL